MKKELVNTLICIGLLALVFLFGYNRGRNAANKPITERVDTLIIRDTIRPEAKIITRRVVDSIPYPVAVHDTIYLPRTQIITGGEDFTAWISGYEPKLDSIEVYPEVKIITKEIPYEVRVTKRWSIGPQIGLGVCATDNGIKPAPYIGIGVSYSLFSW